MRLAILLSVALVCSVRPAAAQPERTPPLRTSEELTKRLREIRGDIEASMGWSIGDQPEVVVVDTETMQRIVLEEAVIGSAWRLPKLRAKTLRMGEGLKLTGVAEGILGKVDLARERIHINLDVIYAISQVESLRSLIWCQDFVDVLLAHEAAHLAQGRRYPFARLYYGASEGARSGLSAIAEGQAQYVARKFAERRGLTEVHEAYTGLHTGAHLDAPPLLKPLLELMAQASSFSYLQGEKFYAAAVKHFGEEVAGRALWDHEFPSRQQITRPSRYLKSERERRAQVEARPIHRIRISLWHDDARPVQTSAELHLWADGPGFEVTVAKGTNGFLEAMVPVGAELRGGALFGPSLEWDVVLGEPLTAQSDGTYRLVVGGEPRRTILVRDTTNGNPLSGARVWAAPVGFNQWSDLRIEVMEPWMGSFESSDAAGIAVMPVIGAAAPDQYELWVQRPGFVTEIRSIPHESVPQVTVDLHPAGALRLDWSMKGASALRELSLARVPYQSLTICPLDLSMEPVSTVPLTPPFELDNLLPGRYEIVAHYRGAPFAAGLRHTLEVRAGASARYEVPPLPPRLAQSVDLRIEVPEAWPIPAIRGLRFEPSDGDFYDSVGLAMLPTPTRENGRFVFRVTLERGEGGPYTVALVPAGLVDEIEIEESTSESLILVPDPVPLRVEVLHADGSLPLEPVSIFVQPCDESGEPLFEDESELARMQGVEWADPRSAEFVRAPGWHLISVHDDLGRSGHRTVRLEGAQEGAPKRGQSVVVRLSH